jgi:hypothetical protein
MSNLIFSLSLNPTNCNERSLIVRHKSFKTYSLNKDEKFVYSQDNQLLKIPKNYRKKQEYLFTFLIRNCI